jgi:anti-sigma-K factor RskA
VKWPIEVSDYVLGELTPEMLRVGDKLVETDAAFRAEVEWLLPVARRLENLPEEAWENVVPPPGPAIPPTPSRPWRRLFTPFTMRPALAVGMCVLLLGAGFGVGVLAGGDASPAAGPATVLTPLPGSPAGARAVAAVVNGDSLKIDVSGLAASADDSFYELWLLNSPDDLVGLASFKVPASGKATLTVPLPADPGRFQFLDISVEPTDGKPSHSGDSVLRGNTT